MQSHGFPVEPVFDNEPEGFTGSKYIRTKTHHEPQTYLAFSPSTSYLNNQGGNSANPNERIIIGSQHPDYGKPYPRGISPGNSGHTHGYLNSDTAQTQLIHERSHTSSNESQSTQFHNNRKSGRIAAHCDTFKMDAILISAVQLGQINPVLLLRPKQLAGIIRFLHFQSTRGKARHGTKAALIKPLRK